MPPSLGGSRTGNSTRSPARSRRPAVASSRTRFWNTPPDRMAVPSPRADAIRATASAVAAARPLWKRAPTTPGAVPRVASATTARMSGRASRTSGPEAAEPADGAPDRAAPEAAVPGEGAGDPARPEEAVPGEAWGAPPAPEAAVPEEAAPVPAGSYAAAPAAHALTGSGYARCSPS